MKALPHECPKSTTGSASKPGSLVTVTTKKWSLEIREICVDVGNERGRERVAWIAQPAAAAVTGSVHPKPRHAAIEHRLLQVL
eukprot:1702224-Prymnesium_polylepis.1